MREYKRVWLRSISNDIIQYTMYLFTTDFEASHIIWWKASIEFFVDLSKKSILFQCTFDNNVLVSSHVWILYIEIYHSFIHKYCNIPCHLRNIYHCKVQGPAYITTLLKVLSFVLYLFLQVHRCGDEKNIPRLQNRMPNRTYHWRRVSWDLFTIFPSWR